MVHTYVGVHFNVEDHMLQHVCKPISMIVCLYDYYVSHVYLAPFTISPRLTLTRLSLFASAAVDRENDYIRKTS